MPVSRQPSSAPSSPKPFILGAAIGECVHVGGIVNFLHQAEAYGYRCRMLGPAIAVEDLIRAVKAEDPDIVAVSYRLTPEAGRQVLEHLHQALEAEGLLAGRRYIFGGTPPVCREAAAIGLFEAIFSQESLPEATTAWLEGRPYLPVPESLAQTLTERIVEQRPYPLLRHHYGQPSVEATVVGVARLADARVMDVISLGPDQNAQEFFFRPEQMDPKEDGAGGVPVRSPDDLRRIRDAARRGNHPLLRCYSGTQDVLQWGRMLVETINNAWCAVPLFWYSLLDGRSQRPLTQSIPEAQELMRYHAQLGVPVEMNESHHWSLRDAPDAVAVAAAVLGAYNARACGVRHYVAQYMFNNPRDTHFRMDLAKMLAKRDLIRLLEGPDFTSYTETRAGLHFFVPDPDLAKGQLAASIMLQMAMQPDIVHVVCFSEAHHAATDAEIIEACKIAHGVIRSTLQGLPEMAADPAVRQRRDELVAEARLILAAVRELAVPGASDPWTDAATLEQAVKVGLFDAPHLYGNAYARGAIRTRVIDGRRVSVDPSTGALLPEVERIRRVLEPHRT